MMFRSSLLITMAQIMTTIAGFGNQLLLAYLFGATATMDAYIAAVSVPGVVTGLAFSVFSFTFLPILVEHVSDQERFKEIATKLFLVTTCASLLISFLGIEGSSVLLKWVAGNLSADSLELALELSSLLWLVAGFTLLNSCLTAIHHSLKQFATPALMTPLPAAMMMASAWILSPYIGIKSVVLGWLVSCIFQVGFLLHGIISRFSLNWLKLWDEILLSSVSRIVPVIASLLPFTILQTIEVFWASGLGPGSVSYLGYCQKIVVSLGSMLIYGISIVSFPYMAEDAARGNTDLVNLRMIRDLRLGLLFGMPIAVWLNIIMQVIMKMGFKWGAFDEQAGKGFLTVLPWYLLGMIPMTLMNVVVRVYVARGKFISLVFFGASPLIYFLLAGLLSQFFFFVGIGMAYAVYWFLLFIVSTIFLKSGLWNGDFLRFLVKLGLAVVLTQLAMSLVSSFMENRFVPLGNIAVVTISGAGVYIGLTYKILRLPEVFINVRRITS